VIDPVDISKLYACVFESDSDAKLFEEISEMLLLSLLQLASLIGGSAPLVLPIAITRNGTGRVFCGLGDASIDVIAFVENTDSSPTTQSQAKSPRRLMKKKYFLLGDTDTGSVS
jgi:hypothetical protein